MPVALRSDTLTQPSPGMRRAMADAEVGDDVCGEDPTATRLEARVAELCGKEAALFVPSGSAAELVNRLAQRGVLVNAVGPRTVRVVTHRDVNATDVDAALDAFAACV